MAQLSPQVTQAQDTRQADENVLSGEVVYVKANGSLALARADALPQADPHGIIVTGAAAGFGATFVTQGVLLLSDWTNTAGTATLTPGARYFLDANTSGKLTKIAPSASGQFVVPVGKAVSTLKLDLDIEPSVLKA